jgi:hypothetical protein
MMRFWGPDHSMVAICLSALLGLIIILTTAYYENRVLDMKNPVLSQPIRVQCAQAAGGVSCIDLRTGDKVEVLGILGNR